MKSFLKEPRPYFGSDLLRAERYERDLEEQQRWTAKLSELDHEDRNRGDSESFHCQDDADWQKEIDQMHFQRAGRSRSPSIDSVARQDRYVHVNQMSEKEHAQYIREGMHRRRYGEPPKEHKRSHRDKIARRAELAAAERLRQRVKEEHRAALKRKELNLARERWETADLAAQDSKTYFWPMPKRVQASLIPSHINDKDLSIFLFSDSSDEQGGARLRKALLRYHPDRFFITSQFKSIQDPMYKSNVQAAIVHISQTLTQIIEARRL